MGSSAEGAPAGLRWLEIEMLAGNVDVRVDDSLSEPQLRGEGRLEASERGFRVRQFSGEKGNSLLDRVIGGIRRGDLKVSIPAGWAVRLDMKAGDVDIRGPIPFLAGDFLAGDLHVQEAHGVDIVVRAGDIRLGLRPTEGRHRVQAVAGDVDVRLLPGSSVRLRGHVKIGDASAGPPITVSRNGLGESLEGTVGDGRAELELQLTTGDLELEVDHG